MYFCPKDPSNNTRPRRMRHSPDAGLLGPSPFLVMFRPNPAANGHAVRHARARSRARGGPGLLGGRCKTTSVQCPTSGAGEEGKCEFFEVVYRILCKWSQLGDGHNSPRSTPRSG